jgi:hypothetical protein
MIATFPISKPLDLRMRIVDFANEIYSEELMDEMKPLWERHKKELEAYEEMELAPDLSLFKACEAAKILRIYTIRKENRLIGYNIFLVTRDPHFKGYLIANQDLVFIEVSERKGMVGYQFMKWCDNELKHEGIQVIFQRINVNHDHGALLKRLGYKPIDVVYRRNLNV